MDSHCRFIVQYVMGHGGYIPRNDLQQALSQHVRHHEQHGGGHNDNDNDEGGGYLTQCIAAINENLAFAHMRLVTTPESLAGRPVHVTMINEIGEENVQQQQQQQQQKQQKNDMNAFMARRATRYSPVQIQYLALILERLVEQAVDGFVSYNTLDAINERTKSGETRRGGGSDDEEDVGNREAKNAISKMSVTECQRSIDRFLRDGWLEREDNIGTGSLWFGVRTLTDLRDFLQVQLDADIMVLDQRRMQERNHQQQRR